MADNLDAHGLRQPIEILPEGTILCGHSRVRAARLLEWEAIDVLVLHHMANASEEAILRYMIDDNMLRRQLSKTKQIQLHAWRIRPDGRHGDWKPEELAAIRAAMHNGPGLDDRTLRRHLHVARTPRAIHVNGGGKVRRRAGEKWSARLTRYSASRSLSTGTSGVADRPRRRLASRSR